MSGIEVVYYGPIFDGRAHAAVDDACEEMAQKISYEGRDDVDAQLNRVLRHQTPLYRLRINARPEPPGWVVNDLDSVYGPWLEGTGSRNKTTRFKGYKTFRIISQRLQRKAARIGSRVLVFYMDRIR